MLELFTTLLLKLLPLYCIIILWYIASHRLGVDKKWIATLLLYIIVPVVMFYGVYSTELSRQTFSLPVLFFFLCCGISIAILQIWSKLYGEDNTKNILAFTAGTWNTGYFGLPVVAALLWPEAFWLTVLALLWFNLYEVTLGFYITAKWQFTVRQSIQKVLKLPLIYAFIAWLLCNALWLHLWEIATTTVEYFKWSYVLLWMMMIGMGLAGINKDSIDIKFLSLSCITKFIVRPAIIFGIIAIDKTFFQIYLPLIHNIMIIMSIVPLAGNTVVVATELNVHPAKASMAVLISTLIALIYIPLMVTFFITG